MAKGNFNTGVSVTALLFVFWFGIILSNLNATQGMFVSVSLGLDSWFCYLRVLMERN